MSNAQSTNGTVQTSNEATVTVTVASGCISPISIQSSLKTKIQNITVQIK